MAGSAGNRSLTRFGRRTFLTSALITLGIVAVLLFVATTLLLSGRLIGAKGESALLKPGEILVPELIAPELQYTGIKNLELRLRLLWLHGRSGTDFGEKQVSRKLEFHARYYF